MTVCVVVTSASKTKLPARMLPPTVTMSRHVSAGPGRMMGETRPEAVAARLQDLLDRQDSGQTLTPAERKEAEGLVDLAEFLTLLRLRAERMSQ